MFIVLGGLSPEIQLNTRVIYTLKKLALSPSKNILSRTAEPIVLKFCTKVYWPKALSGKLFLWRVRQPRASYARKTCFWGSRKSCFSWITFFFLDMEESGQSKVCRASDARNFGTKFVGIEAIWPRFSPDWKMTLCRPLFTLTDLQPFWPDRLSWFWCHSIRHHRSDICPYHSQFFDPGLPWPATARQTQKWSFLGVFGFFDN